MHESDLHYADTLWKAADALRMNSAVNSIEADLGTQPADAFLRDLHPELRADYIPTLNRPRARSFRHFLGKFAQAA